jgi:octaprenyl-diphosphate synthase
VTHFSSPSIAAFPSLRKPIEQELAAFDTFFRDAMRSRVKVLDFITRYIVKQKGKRVRPMLVLLSAKACGEINDKTYRAASLVEILHTATLVHDDVVDDADTRRGVASINFVWKNKVAVLIGDFLLSRGLLLALEHQDYMFLYATSNAVKRMSEGELLQIQKSRQLNLDEPTYLKIISDKTASLFSTCTEIGAMSATDDQGLHEQFRLYGENLGIVFQIRDDLFDYESTTGAIGKPTGQDVKEKKLTLPLIYALGNAERSDSKKALRLVKGGASKKDQHWLLDFVRQQGGLEYTMKRAKDFAGLAKESIASIPDSQSKQALSDFIDFVLSREA